MNVAGIKNCWNFLMGFACQSINQRGKAVVSSGYVGKAVSDSVQR